MAVYLAELAKLGQLPIANCQLPITNCQLPIANCKPAAGAPHVVPASSTTQLASNGPSPTDTGVSAASMQGPAEACPHRFPHSLARRMHTSHA
jgi:hypothetical protein